MGLGEALGDGKSQSSAPAAADISALAVAQPPLFPLPKAAKQDFSLLRRHARAVIADTHPTVLIDADLYFGTRRREAQGVLDQVSQCLMDGVTIAAHDYGLLGAAHADAALAPNGQRREKGGQIDGNIRKICSFIGVDGERLKLRYQQQLVDQSRHAFNVTF